jgi:hypothetical protein
MKHAVEPDVTGTLSIFERACVYCGARFRVLATQRSDADHAEAYSCPDCGKSYRTQALIDPEVRLLRPRSDGRVDRYQDTVF